MKKILLAFLVLCSSVFAVDRYDALITVTNNPSHGMTFTVNGDTRTWRTNETLSVNQIAVTNTTFKNATNLYLHIAGTSFAGPVTPQMYSSNQVRLVNQPGNPLTITMSNAWGYVTVTTNSVTTAYAVRVPIVAEPTATYRTNISSQLVKGINDFATNSFNAAVLGGVVFTNNQNQTIDGVKNFLQVTTNFTGFVMTNNLSTVDRKLYSAGQSGAQYSIDWGNRIMRATGSDVLYWQDKKLVTGNAANDVTVDWGNKQLMNTSIAVLDWSNGNITDSSNNNAANWFNRTLNSTNFGITVDWQRMILKGSSGGWTVSNNFQVVGGSTFGDGTSVTLIKTATASLIFTNALTIGQSETNTVTLTGAIPGDAVIPRLPGTLPADSIFQIYVAESSNALNVVRFALTNTSGITNTFGGTIVRH